MRTSHMFRPRVLTAVVALVLVATSTACGADNSHPSASSGRDSSASPSKTTAKELEPNGVLTVGCQPEIPPDVYVPEGQSEPVGFEVDLIKRLADGIGLKVEYKTLDWSSLVPAVKAGRIDVAMCQIGDFTDRQKQVDFVDTDTVGSGVIVRTENAGSYKKELDLCGKTIGAQSSTSAPGIVRGVSKKCVADGLPEVHLVPFESDDTAVLAVQSGRLDGEVIDLHTGAFKAKALDDGKTLAMVLPHLVKGVLVGIAVPKDNRALSEALRDELQKIMDSGEYMKILDKWGVGGAALSKATINGGTTSSAG